MSDHPRAGVVDLVTSGEAAAGAAWWYPMLLVLAICAACVVLLVLARRMNGRDPAARAFVRLARGLGLSRSERRQVQDLAACADVAPVALLLSPAKLRSTAQRVDEQADLRAVIEKICSG